MCVSVRLCVCVCFDSVHVFLEYVCARSTLCVCLLTLFFLSAVVTCRGSNLRVHFKNTRETAMALKGMTLGRAQKYLNNVIAHKEAIPMRRFMGGPGRHAQAKIYGVSQCR